MKSTAIFQCLFLSVLVSSVSFGTFAAKPAPPMSATNLIQQNKTLLFEENKGQLLDENRSVISDVKYYGHTGGVYLYCKPGTISFVFTKAEKAPDQVSEANGLPVSEKMTIAAARMDLVLIGSNPVANIIATDQQQYHENFYTTGDANNGIMNVHTYKTITYKNIYPDIDMILKTAGQGMEYSFLVHPGGNVSDIQLRWNGTDNTEVLRTGGIKYSNNLGSLEESAPKSFSNGEAVQSSFINEGDYLGFKVKNYNRSNDLLIDPGVTWATYYSSSGTETINGLSTDASGNVYITGQSLSNTGIATSGAFQTLYSNVLETAFLTKFTSSGSLSWGTYYGGSTESNATGISTDNSWDVFISGTTYSTTGFATSGAYQTVFSGSEGDNFLSKFDSSGSLSWATYFGGTVYSSPYIVVVSTDASGNAFVAGTTSSTTGIASSGAYQTFNSGLGGNDDGFLAKFSSTGKLTWGTYYGNDSASISAVHADASGNIYIFGKTTATKGIATTGAYQTSNIGSDDDFLTKFSSSGSLLWATYYGEGNETQHGLCTDISGNVYINGSTSSTSGIATAGAHQTSLAGVGDAYLAKFSSSGGLAWATYYGGPGDDAGRGASVDAKGNVYITGWTESSTGITTPGAYQASIGLFSSGVYYQTAYLAKFNSSGSLSFGTYYGGTTAATAAAAIGADPSGNMYITGTTLATSGIATSGAYLTAYVYTSSSYNGNAFLAKFNFKTFQNDAGIDSLGPSGTVCAGLQPVKANIYNYGANALTSATINWSVNRVLQTSYSYSGSLAAGANITLKIGSFNFVSGADTLKVWTSKPNGKTDSVPSNDTAWIIILANPSPTATVGSPASICGGNNVTIGAKSVSGYYYSWTSNPAGFTSNSPKPSVNPTVTTKYILTATINATGCSNTDSVTITVSPSPPAYTGKAQSICSSSSSSVTIGGTAISGDTYSWTSSPAGFTSTSANPSVNPSVTIIYILTETVTLTSCSKTDSVTVSVNPPPNANAGNPQNICAGDSAMIGATAVGGDGYSWISSPTGFSSTVSNPIVKPTSTTTYTLTETAGNCTKSNSVKITVNPAPSANAGSPQTICAGNSAKIGTTGVGGNTYSWVSSPTGFTSTMSNPSVNPSVTTTYTLTETGGNCTKSNSVEITVSPLPNAGWTVSNTSQDYHFYFHVQDSSFTKSSYSWDFGDGTNFTGYSTSHLYSQKKTYTVKLIVTNVSGCVSEHDSIIDVTALGINTIINPDLYGLSIYPNPFTDKTLVNFTLPEDAYIKISVMDMKGNILFVPANKTFNSGANKIEINAAETGLVPGTYFVNIEINGEFISKKIIEVR